MQIKTNKTEGVNLATPTAKVIIPLVPLGRTQRQTLTFFVVSL